LSPSGLAGVAAVSLADEARLPLGRDLSLAIQAGFSGSAAGFCVRVRCACVCGEWCVSCAVRNARNAVPRRRQRQACRWSRRRPPWPRATCAAYP
jgi:hypothetical protein